MPKEPKAAPKIVTDGQLSTTARDELRSYADRATNLIEERDRINEDLREVMNEAKDSGFDTKILRKAIKEIRSDAAQLNAERAMIDLYKHAIQPDLFSEAA